MRAFLKPIEFESVQGNTPCLRNLPSVWKDTNVSNVQIEIRHSHIYEFSLVMLKCNTIRRWAAASQAKRTVDAHAASLVDPKGAATQTIPLSIYSV